MLTEAKSAKGGYYRCQARSDEQSLFENSASPLLMAAGVLVESLEITGLVIVLVPKHTAR